MNHIACLLPLEPNRSQEQIMWKCAGAARWSFNWALATSKEEYEKTGSRPSAYDLIRRITQLKRTEDFGWLAEISKQVPQYAIHNVEKAFQNFFRRLKSGRNPGYPKFKKRGKCKVSFRFGDTAGLAKCIRGRKIMLPTIGLIRIADCHPRIPDGRPLSITVKHYGDRWYAVVCYEVKIENPLPNCKPSIGVDLGITSFATLSTGEKIESPKPLRNAMKRIKRLQRKLSRSQKDSHRRERKRRVLARAHARVRNIRQSFIHQLTARLAKNYGHVCIEDLAVRNMVRNHHLAFAIGDSGWGEFRRQLEYKCPRHGTVLVIADRFYPSSKRCNVCGTIKPSLSLSVREWTCEQCGEQHDRDINAAKNLSQLRRDTAEVTRMETGEQEPEMVPVPVCEVRSTGKAIASAVK